MPLMAPHRLGPLDVSRPSVFFILHPSLTNGFSPANEALPESSQIWPSPHAPFYAGSCERSRVQNAG